MFDWQRFDLSGFQRIGREELFPGEIWNSDLFMDGSSWVNVGYTTFSELSEPCTEHSLYLKWFKAAFMATGVWAGLALVCRVLVGWVVGAGRARKDCRKFG